MVTISRASETVMLALRIWLPRWFAARNISVGTPSNIVTTATFENSTRANGREMRAKTSPVATAMLTMLKKDSAVTSTLA